MVDSHHEAQSGNTFGIEQVHITCPNEFNYTEYYSNFAISCYSHLHVLVEPVYCLEKSLLLGELDVLVSDVASRRETMYNAAVHSKLSWLSNLTKYLFRLMSLVWCKHAVFFGCCN